MRCIGQQEEEGSERIKFLVGNDQGSLFQLSNHETKANAAIKELPEGVFVRS